MRIYTKIVMDMTQDDLPVVDSDSYEYDGPVALCVDGRGDASNNNGRGDSESGNGSSGSDGGPGNGGGRGDSGGGGGFGGQGVGNRTASRGGMAAENARGGLGSMGGFGGGGNGLGAGMNSIGQTAANRGWSDRSGIQSAERAQASLNNYDTANKMSKGLRGIGAVTGALPVSIAGHAMGLANEHARRDTDLSDMEKAAKANGMGETQRGDGSAMAKALAGNLNLKDPAQKALHDSIIPPGPTSPTPTKTGAQLREYARA